MKLEFVIVIACTAIVSSSFTIVVIRYYDRTVAHGYDGKWHEAEQRVERMESALSNYNRTFKLNTAAPRWPEEQRGSNDFTNRTETNSR